MSNLRQISWSRSTCWLVAILVVALAARVAVALYLGNTVSGLSGAHDEISYSMLGQRFAAGQGMTFPTNWYPWIEANAPQSYFSYTISLFLAAIYKIVGYQPLVARLVMVGLSVAVVGMVYLVAARLFDRQVGLLSAGIAAVYAYLVFYGATLVTETPFLLALLVALYCCLRIVEKSHWGWWIILGVALAVAVLLRMAVVFYVPVLLLWTVWDMEDRAQRRMIVVPIVFMIAAIAPLTIRNYRMWDQFLFLESQFGHVFWNGNHPGHLGNFHPYRVFPIPEEVLASGNDVVITNKLLRMGIENVVNNPADFLSLTLTRLREFYKFWPTADSSTQANLLRVLSFGILVPFALAGLIINLPRWRELLPIYLLIVIHTGIYAVTWTMIRYRVPLDAFFIMFAASAVTILLRSRRPKSHLDAIDKQQPAN